MKRILLFLLILGTTFAIFANPFSPQLIDKIYFTGEGNTIRIHISPELQWLGEQNLTFNVGTTNTTFTIDFTNAADPIFFDFADTGVSPQQGHVDVSCDDYINDQATWGPGIENDFSPLSGTQCAMRAYINYMEGTIPIYAKDFSPYSGEFMNPLARSTVLVNCVNADGGVFGVPVYAWNPWNPWGYTNESGQANLSIYSGKVTITVRDPLTQAIACDSTFFAEPDSVYTLTALLTLTSNDDTVIQTPGASFSIYPSVLRGSHNNSLNLDYDAKLFSAAQIELYDIKGRLIAKQDYSGSMTWQLPKLGSGVYFLRLYNGKVNLGVQKLIVLK